MIGRSTGVICEEKNVERTEMKDKINDDSKRKITRTYYRCLVPGTSPNTWWYSVWFEKKHRTPLRGGLAPPATLAHGRMQLKHL